VSATHRLLPPLPVDDTSLGIYWDALHPAPGIDKRSSLGEVLRQLTFLAGSDVDAVDDVTFDEDHTWSHMSDPQYHVHELVSALIEALREARST